MGIRVSQRNLVTFISKNPRQSWHCSWWMIYPDMIVEMRSKVSHNAHFRVSIPSIGDDSRKVYTLILLLSPQVPSHQNKFMSSMPPQILSKHQGFGHFWRHFGTFHIPIQFGGFNFPSVEVLALGTDVQLVQLPILGAEIPKVRFRFWVFFVEGRSW